MKKILILALIIIGFLFLLSDVGGDHIIGIILILIGCYILLRKHLRVIFRQINQKINSLSIESSPNCRFDFNYDILRILDHKLLKQYFESDIFEKEEKYLLEDIKSNAKKMLIDGSIKENVIIQIKNNDIYINEKINLEDVFMHEIFIPFNLETFNKESYSIYEGITIRTIIVNGILKVQIGNFNHCEMNIISTENIGTNYYTYKNYFDIFQLSLIHNESSLFISKKHLNIVTSGIEGYYNKEGIRFSSDWKSKWQKLHRDLEDYLYLQSLGIEHTTTSTETNILENFSELGKNTLEKYNISVDYNDDDYFTQKHLGYMNRYHNGFVIVSISDLNQWYEDRYKEISINYIKEEFYP